MTFRSSFLSWLLDGHGLELLHPFLVVVDKALGFANVASGIEHHGGNGVWANVGGWSSVLDVTLTIVMHNLSWDSERAGSVSCSIRELVDTGGLMDSCKSLVVICTVELDVEGMLVLEVNHHVVNIFHFPGTSSHGLGGEISVASGTVPVGENLWLKGDGHIEFLCASVKEIPG